MKNLTGYFVLSVSIIVASIIIYMSNQKKLSSLDHCYYKVYASELKELENYKEAYPTQLIREENAARKARSHCLEGY